MFLLPASRLHITVVNFPLRLHIRESSFLCSPSLRCADGVEDLGVTSDARLSFKHTTSTASFAAAADAVNLSLSAPAYVVQTVLLVFATSCLDYCNAVSCGKAARVFCQLPAIMPLCWADYCRHPPKSSLWQFVTTLWYATLAWHIIRNTALTLFACVRD